MTGTSMPSVESRYDVVVAGARVAGAATAMLMARAGLKVLVVDPSRRGSDTLSTHALMRGGVMQLQRWGLLDRLRAAGTPTIEWTTFHYGDEPVRVEIEPRDGIDGLYAPRRTVLDALLVDAALEAGARIEHGISVADLLEDGDGRVRGVRLSSPDGGSLEVEADLVVGADGMRSRIAKRVGAQTVRQIEDRTASIYGYVGGLEDQGYQWYFGDRRAMGEIPTNDGETCVFVSLPPDRLLAERSRGLDALFLEVVDAFTPEVARHVQTHGMPKLRAFAGAPSVLRQAWGPGWALVGDAGYFKDPLTAHGITDALVDAELLARAAASGDEAGFRAYSMVRNELAEGLMRVTGEIASLDWTLPQVAELHRELSREMNAEVKLIRSWELASIA